MIAFGNLPTEGKSVILIVLFLLLIEQGVGTYLAINGKKTKTKIVQILQVVVTMVLLSFLAEENAAQFSERKLSLLTVWIGKIPAILLFLYAVSATFYSWRVILAEYKTQKSEINKSTIKESADTLPMGLCFARLNGHPYLVNEKMNELSNQLRRKNLQNEESFWTYLKEGKLENNAKKLSSDETPVIQLGDGTIWVFRQKMISIQEQQVMQLTATDSTQLYELYEKLQMKNHDLEIMNQKLQEYEEQIEDLTKTQERLALKIRIHDAIGQNLIATKYFLQRSHEKSELSKILKKWEHSVAILHQEIKEEDDTHALQYLTDAAQSAGVQVVIDGQVPGVVKVQEMIVAAGAEALTNAVRHAGAEKLWISIRETASAYNIAFKNEGNQTEQVEEGGGLSSLRKRIENLCGSMQIIADKDFILKITLPKQKEDGVYDKCTDCGR